MSDDEDAVDEAGRAAAAPDDGDLPHAAAPPPAAAGAPAAPAVVSSPSSSQPSLMKSLLMARDDGAATTQNGRVVKQKKAMEQKQIVVFKGTPAEETITRITGTSPAEDPGASPSISASYFWQQTALSSQIFFAGLRPAPRRGSAPDPTGAPPQTPPGAHAPGP